MIDEVADDRRTHKAELVTFWLIGKISISASRPVERG
jgi:hypothetical protein